MVTAAVASQALGFLGGVMNFMNSPDFTEQDRIIIQKYQQLGEEIPTLDTEARFPGIMQVLGKLAAHGYEPASAQLEAAKVTLDPSKQQQWDEAIAGLKEMATEGVTQSERAGIQEAAEGLSRVFTGQQAQATEIAARRGIRGPATLAALNKNIGQASAEAGKAMGREVNRGMGARKGQAMGQLVQATGARQQAGYQQTMGMANYINAFNQWAAGSQDAAAQYTAGARERADTRNLQNEMDTQRFNIEGQYKAGRTNQAISNQAAQWQHGARERALAGEAEARRGLTQNLAAQTRGQEQGIRGMAEALPAVGQMFGMEFDPEPEGRRRRRREDRYID